MSEPCDTIPPQTTSIPSRSQVSEGWNPPVIIRHVHEFAASIGYERVRVDRGVRSEHEWYEAGYGCGTVKVRMLHTAWEITKENFDRTKLNELERMLTRGCGC